MRAWHNIIILLLSLTITTSCDKPNVLTEYSKTDGDEALFLESQKKMDKLDWDGAIGILTTDLSPTFRATVKVKERLMHAYGGKCGISFFDMISRLKNLNSTKMFDVALKIFDGRQVDLASCDAAINVLHDLGATAATRTSDQNIFAAILGLTRMGVTIKTKMDTESSGLGNGIVDAGWDSCTVSSAVNRLSDAEMDRVATGVGLIFENLVSLGSELSGTGSGDSFDDAKSLCETPLTLPPILDPEDYGADPGTPWTDFGLPASPTYADFGFPSDIADPLTCTNTLDSAVPAKMRRTLRRLISSSDIGFGSCTLSLVNLNANAAPNPSYNMGLPTSPTNPKFIATFEIVSNCCPGLATP